MLIASAIIIVGLNACTKQDYAPIPQPTTQPAQQAKVDLVATSWTNLDGGIYESTLENALANLPMANGSRLNVYVQEDNGQLILISGSPVIYKGHALWAATSHYDVTVRYNCPEAPMPFQALHIVVAVN